MTYETTPLPPTGQPDMEKKPLLDPPEGGDELAKTWKKRIEKSAKKLEKFHTRIKHNRKLVSGFDWSGEPDSSNFYQHRANLIHGTITAILPNIYARNPEMSVTAHHQGRDLKLLCKTLEKVTNRQLVDAGLKKRAKATVRAALTVSIGAVKVLYQRDINDDPIIKGRIQDTQDNIKTVEALLQKLDDPQACADQEAIKAELEETMKGLQEKVEVVAAEGLVVDRILSEHFLLDDTVAEFEDYADGDFMVHLIPMRKSTAEGIYGYKLNGATAYKEAGHKATGTVLEFSNPESGADYQICLMEIWDKRSQRVFTTAQGLDFWLKPAFSPKCVGERWYPFFLLPFQLVDGQVVGPSLVDLLERLQKEHNDTRDKEVAHRELIKPGWVASSDVNEKSIKRYQDSVLGEITILDAEGKPIQNMIMAKNHPPIDPATYDTTKVRFDWEQVSGMQDAARSTVVNAKTATEANIMQQSLSGRVSEFRDQVEDFLQEISQYSAQILLQELTPQQVERIMGPHKTGPLMNADGTPMLDPATNQPVIGVIEPAYDWPELSRDEVFDMVQLQIRSGTTGEPDKIEQQETWIKLMPVIQPLITSIMNFQLKGIDTTALVALLKETVARFDDKLDIEPLIPKLKPLPPPPMALPAGAAPDLLAA